MNKKGLGLTIVGALGALLGLGWWGLRTQPKPPTLPVQGKKDVVFAPLPPDMPRPLRRHYELAYGQQAPVVETAVLLGRARIRMGTWLPIRFSAYHLLGHNFLRNIEVTWFNLPILKVEDYYIDGRGRMDVNGQITEGCEIDQAAKVNMWCEAILFPHAGTSLVNWEAVEDHTARLIMPNEGGEDTATVTFDPTTGFMRRYTAMRYRDVGESQIPWHVDYLNWIPFGDMRFPQQVKVTWEDQGKPWFEGVIDDVFLDVTVPEKMQIG